MLNFLIFSVILIIILIINNYFLYRFLNKKTIIATNNINLLKQQFQQKEIDYNHLLSQKKSSEVNLGLIGETLVPFLSQFPFDPKNARFLGQPIDYIIFDENGIHFVEIKTSNAKLSSKQRIIKEQIKNKLVDWKEINIKNEGYLNVEKKYSL